MSDDTFHKMVSVPEIQGQWTEPKVGDRTDKGVVTCIDEEARDRSEPWIYIVKRSGAKCRYYRRRELIYHPTQKDLRGMLPHKEGRYYSLGWGADEQGVVGYKLNIYQWQKLQETFYGTAKEALAQGVMHGHGKRWDQDEGWKEKNHALV